jgi:hypothetical protein
VGEKLGLGDWGQAGANRAGEGVVGVGAGKGFDGA